jgi:CxxC motif-containing protein
MAETRRFVCIVCPRGCSLEVEVLLGTERGAKGSPSVAAVRGNSCKRGEEYARREVVDPRRTLTSTVRTRGSARRRLSVKTSCPIPLMELRRAARALDGVVVSSPLKCGDVVLGNLLGLGVDVVATDDL